MAWRIDQSVVRGEIDNRARGRVTGRLWVMGRADPIVFNLTGNAWRDIAGRRLLFANPDPQPADLRALNSQQDGVIGDCTASRKVKVPDVPAEELMALYQQKKPYPWHWGNSLYFEWFSRANGRCVVESATYQLTVAPDGAWEMSAEEEEAQRTANAEALRAFMADWAEGLAPARPSAEAGSENIDTPLSEAEAEKMQAESEQLVDRIQARLDREGDQADYEKILEEELERRARERGDPPLTLEEESAQAAWVEEMNRAAEAAEQTPDPAWEEGLMRKHPAAEWAAQLSIRLMKESEQAGWVPDEASAEHPVLEMTSRVMSAAAKFAGALNGHGWPPSVHTCANSIVRLKKARDYLDDALQAADSCADGGLVDAAWLEGARRDVTSLAEECDALIVDLRGRLERGFD